MAISYLSAPIKPGVIPEQIPIELVSQVAMQKQNKYDQALESIFAQYTNILNLDTSGNNEITQKYYRMMKEADKNLTSLAKLDFLNPDNAQKVEGIFNPILQDEDILMAVQGTKEYQSAKATTDYWKKNKSDLYYSKNEEFNSIKHLENKLMSAKDYKEKRNIITARPFFDIKKDLIEQAKALPSTKSVTSTTNGFYVTTTSGDIKTQDEIMQFLSIDARHISQAEVNSFFEYRNTTGEELVNAQMRRMDVATEETQAVIKQVNESISAININLDKLKGLKDSEALPSNLLSDFSRIYGEEVPVGTTVGQIRETENMKLENRQAVLQSNVKRVGDLESQRTEYLTALNASLSEDANGNPLVSFAQPLDKDILDHLKTQEYLSVLKTQVAQGMSINDISIKQEADEYGMVDYLHNNKIKLEIFKAELEDLKAKYNPGENTGTNTGKPKDENAYVPGVADGQHVEEFDYDVLRQKKNQARVAINNAEENLHQQIVEQGNHETTQYGNLPDFVMKDGEFVIKDGKKVPNPVKEEIKEKAKKAIEMLEKHYQTFLSGAEEVEIDDINGGKVKLLREDFFKSYGFAVPMYETILNNRAFIDLAEQIENSIGGNIKPKFFTKEAQGTLKQTALSKGSKFEYGILYKDIATPDDQWYFYYDKQAIIGIPPEMGRREEPIDVEKIRLYNLEQGNDLSILKDSKTFSSSMNSGKFFSETEKHNLKVFPTFTTDKIAVINESLKYLKTTGKTPVVYVKKGTSPYENLIPLATAEPDINGNIANIDPSDVTNLSLIEDPDTGLLNLRVVYKNEGSDAEGEGSTRIVPITPEARTLLGPEVAESLKVMEISRSIDLLMREQAARESKAYINTDTHKKPEITVIHQGIPYTISAGHSKGYILVKQPGYSVTPYEANLFPTYIMEKNNYGNQSYTIELEILESKYLN